MKLYENIKKKRKALGLTQEELAKRLGYADKSMISKVEAGKIDLSISMIENFAKELNTTAPELMGWEDTIEYLSMRTHDFSNEVKIVYPKQGQKILDAVKDATPDEINQAIAYINFLKGQRA